MIFLTDYDRLEEGAETAENVAVRPNNLEQNEAARDINQVNLFN